MARKCGERGRRGEGAAVTLLFSAESLHRGEVKTLLLAINWSPGQGHHNSNQFSITQMEYH